MGTVDDGVEMQGRARHQEYAEERLFVADRALGEAGERGGPDVSEAVGVRKRSGSEAQYVLLGQSVSRVAHLCHSS